MRLVYLSLFCFATFLPFNTKAQNKTDQFLFPEFKTGVIKYKAGQRKQAKLNYNKLTEEMVFDNNGVLLALIDDPQIDTVYLNQKKFIPEGRYFFEVNTEAATPFFIQHRFAFIPPAKKVGYGGRSETSATQSMSHLTEGGQIYNLQATGDYKLWPANVLRLKTKNKYAEVANWKDLIALMPEKKEQLKNLSKSQKIDFQNEEDFAKLLKQL